LRYSIWCDNMTGDWCTWIDIFKMKYKKGCLSGLHFMYMINLKWLIYDYNLWNEYLLIIMKPLYTLNLKY
jgi:hypothetical protein